MTPALRRRLAATTTAVLATGLLSASVLAPSAPATAAAGDPYTDSSLTVSQRVTDLLSRMTLDDKLGQMTQVDHKALTNQQDLATYRIGSVLSGGSSDPSSNGASAWTELYESLQRVALSTPLAVPMIYGIDAVHGHSNVTGATIFPHNIGLGATRDPELAQRIGRATAEEISATGIDWTFAPCLCVARNDRWGRTYESFGEKPELATSLSTVITGLQTDSLTNHGAVLATAKHYIGDGGTTGGVDQGNTQVSESELRSIHLPPFKAAIDKGVGSVMISYSSWNGQKLHGNRYLVNDVLKGELGFKGFVVSDWAGIDQIDGARGISATDVVQSVNAGIDMVMVPNDYKTFLSLAKQAVQNGQITQTRVNDAVTRILTKKFELGLFERPWVDRTFAPVVGSAEHRAIAREAVRKSLVLLKNQNSVLPLAKSGGKIFVAGKSADDIGNQSGGWTIDWQGASGATTTGTTVLQGIRSAVGSGRSVTYNRDGYGFDSSYSAAIAVVGETPYAEGNGDRTSSMGLDSTDLATLSRLQGQGVPVIVVLVSGRPLDIASQVGSWNALVAAWLPGTEGNGVSDVLFGDYAPTGKLPVTWMQSASQQPINDGDGKAALYPYGYGLTYAAPTTTTTTRPTTTTTRPTTTTTTTNQCQPTQPIVSSTTSSSITWTITLPSGCPGAGSFVRLYASQADAQAGTNVVASGFADFGIRTLTVGGLKAGTDYWWSFGSNLPIGGPTRTSASPTTTTRTCLAALPSVTGSTSTSISYYLPSTECSSVPEVRVTAYASQADAAAEVNPVSSVTVAKGVSSATVTGLRPDTDYWSRTTVYYAVLGPTRTKPAATTTTTTTTIPTTTTTTTTRATWTCQPALPGVSGVTASSITWTIPSSPCPSVGSFVRVFGSLADAQAGTNVVASGFADFGITTLTVSGLASGTDYWWSFGSSLPIGGPTRTSATTTTTRTSTTTTVCSTTGAYPLIGRTSTTMTFGVPGSTCIPQAVFEVSLYDSAARTNLVASASAQRPATTITVCGLRPDTDYWASFMVGSSGGPYRTLATGVSPTGPTYTTSGYCPSRTTTTTSTTTTTVPQTTTTTTTAQSTACTATYKVVGAWPGGFQGEVTITAGSAPINAWTVSWPLAAGQTINQAWNATLTTSGSVVTAKSLSWNGTQGAGFSTTLGFLGSWSGSNPVPAVTCTSP